ncbi:large neutral amino acids transporter small subunit 1-like [Centruroides sculpturatus]|nr:large neutral amino acids transporter small subunit 1-like [Centruroides sculpturatus]
MFSVGGMLWLRIKQPHMERPIKINLAIPVIFMIVCIFLVFLPFYVSPWETGIGIAITVSGIPVYFLTIYWKDKPKMYKKVIAWITLITQKLLISVEQEGKVE